MNDGSASRGLLRAVALVTAVAGAAGSVALMLRVGYRNGSSIPALLLILFTGWVLSPFIGLVVAWIIAKEWSAPTRATLHVLMLLVTLGSLAVYGYVALSPPRPKPAFAFLVVPLGSGLLVMTGVPIAALLSSSRSNHDG